MSFPRYPEYKDSGVAWLGAVPAHWTLKRLRFAAEFNPSKSELKGLSRDMLVSFLPMEAIGDDGSLNLERERRLAEVETGYTYFRDGDVVVAKITPCYENGKGAIMNGLVNGIGFGTTELIVARPQIDIVKAEFLHYLFRSSDFRSIGESYMYGAGGQKRVPDDYFRNFNAALPPLEEQKNIIQFLNCESIKITLLIEEQQHLIELLQEKRQAVIAHAVTKGLNPDAPMKPSGVEWLGEVPAHWEVVQSRRLFRARNEMAHETDVQLTASQKYGILPQVDFVEAEGRRVVEMIKGVDTLRHVEPNDFVISLRSFQGGIEWSKVRGSVTWHYVVLEPIKHVYPPFFAYLFKSINYIQALRSTTNLIRDGQDLRYSHFVQVDLPKIPVEEQKQIAEFLDRETAAIDALIAETERAIDLLQERRQALISAAVTGQIDVRQLTNVSSG